MTAQSESTPLADAFAEHVQAFHAGLPAEEQALLEELFALAEWAATAGADTEGHVFKTVKLGLDIRVSPSLNKVLSARPLGTEVLGQHETL